MVFTASYYLQTAQALGPKAKQSDIVSIKSRLKLDPKVSEMDAVILGPKDITRSLKNELQEAIDNAHPDVCVIYVYKKDSERDKINCKYKRAFKKVTRDSITEVVDDFLGKHISERKLAVVSKDATVQPVIEAKVEVPKAEPVTKEPEPVPVVETPDSAPEMQLEPVEVPELIQEEPPAITPPKESFEGLFKEMESVQDFSLVKEQLTKERVERQLIERDTEYVGLIQMLEVLQRDIDSVFSDPALDGVEKFDKIRELGVKRVNLKGRANNILIDKVIHLLDITTTSAVRVIDRQVKDAKECLATIAMDKSQLCKSQSLSEAVARRAAIQIELHETMMSLIDLYKTMNDLACEEIEELPEGLPSSNKFINEFVVAGQEIKFTPKNTLELTMKLTEALQSNRLAMSQIEDKLRTIFELIFELTDKDNEVIQHQQRIMDLMKANRIEDIVIRDSVLKNCLRLYVGTDNTGWHSTAITQAGILSRRQNSLLIDISGRDKFDEYGITAYTLDDFMTQMLEDQLVCVKCSKPDPEVLSEIVQRVKEYMGYYPYVNIIVDVDDTEIIDQLSVDALSVNYITDCSERSMDKIKYAVGTSRVANIAHKIIMIDAPINPLLLAEKLDVDVTMTKIVLIPNIRAIKAARLNHMRPFENSITREIYEEAF